MKDKNEARLRRARQTRLRIHEQRVPRLAVHRTNSHIYVQLYSDDGAQVLARSEEHTSELQSQ